MVGGGAQSQCSITSQEVVGEAQTSRRDESVRLMQSVYIRRESQAIPEEKHIFLPVQCIRLHCFNVTKNITSNITLQYCTSSLDLKSTLQNQGFITKKKY